MKNWLFNGKTQLKRKSTSKCHCCRHQISHFRFKGCIENGGAFYYAYCFGSHELASLDVATFSSITYTVSRWIRCNHNHLLSWIIAFANYMQIKQHFTQNNTAKTTTTTVITKRHRHASRHSWTKSTISTHIHWVESKGHSKKQIESCIRVNSMVVFLRNVLYMFFWQYSVFHKQNYSSYIVIPILFKQFYFQ